MTGGRKGYNDYGRKRKTGIGAWSPLLFWYLARVLLLGVNVDRKCEKMEPGVVHTPLIPALGRQRQEDF